MYKNNIRTPADALAYFTDCQLATVETLAAKKSPPKHDYKRQISIAQHMVDLIREFKIVDEGNRFNKVFLAGSVENHANAIHASYFPEIDKP
jgi:hypothetical protein